MKSIMFVMGVLILALSIILASVTFSHQESDIVYENYEAMLDAINDNNRQIAEYNRLLSEKKDTLKIIEKQKTIISQQDKENQDEIRKTNDIDSLIVLYYKHRTDDNTKRQQ